MKAPFFSIITVCYNSENTISKTIESILKQSFQNFEYIIIDGKSTDKTVHIIKSFEEEFARKKLDFHWVSEKDIGIYDAFNKGLEIAKGKWISFLGSDDIYVENALQYYFKEIKKLNYDIDFIHSKVKVESKRIISNEWKWKNFKKKMSISHVGSFHNKNYFKEFGLFDDTLRIAGDYEMLLRKKNILKTHYFDKLTVIMGNSGVSNSMVVETYKETTDVKNKHKTQSLIKNKIDYTVWRFKLFLKNILHAIIR